MTVWSLYLAALGAALIPLVIPISRNFEYEYCLLASLICSFGLPWTFFLWQKNPALNRRIIIHSFLAPFLWCLILFAAIRLGLSLCSPEGFAIWFLFQCLPAWFLGLGLGCLFARVHAKINGFGTSVLLVTFSIFAIALLIICLWFFPQKRITYLFTGFLHGPIYDQLILLSPEIMFKRLLHFFAAIWLWLYFAKQTIWPHRAWAKKTKTVLIFIGIAAIISVNYTITQKPGVSIGTTHLNKLLSERITGNGFEIYSQKNQKGIDSLYWQVKFHIQELAQLLGQNSYPLVKIYVYPNEKHKKLWFGGGSTDVADVYTPSIHIMMQNFPHATLRHELVHALASGFGFHGLGFHPNMALTEGLAVALAPMNRALGLDQSVMSLKRKDRLPPLKSLFSFNFWTFSGPRAYATAGSFLRFLLTTQGSQSIVKLYSGSSFNSVFDQSPTHLQDQWLRYIENKVEKTKADLYGEALFRYDGIFSDRCAHSKVDLKPSHRAELLQSCLTDRDYSYDDYWKWREKLQPLSPAVRLKRLRWQLYSLQGVGKLSDDLKQKFKLLDQSEITSLEDVEIRVLMSDWYLNHGLAPKGESILKKTWELRQQFHLGPNLLRAIQARLFILDLPSERQGPWLKYLAGWGKLPAKPSHPHWVENYLRLRKGKHEIKAFDLKSLPPKDAVASFFWEWYRLLAFTWIEHSNWTKATASLRLAKNYAGPEQKLWIDEQIRYIRFRQRN